LGLLLWASAVTDGPGLGDLLAASGLSLGSEGSYTGHLTSMEASWLLSGLLHEQTRYPQRRTRQVAEAVTRELLERYAQSGGLMPHASTRAPLKHRVRRRIANFADQIYTVQAMAFASIVLGAVGALRLARALTEKLVTLQGPQGQWWWHYDASAGRVAERYPVYSVHQHAMGPMALMALEAAGGGEFPEALSASHEWLTDNELGLNLIDEPAQTIWRDVEQASGRASTRLRHLRMLLGSSFRVEEGHIPVLRLNRETRPYEWGWCLYAGAIANGTHTGSHLV
jgi:hypothetical protein